jgi:hypothetical protein
LESDQRGATTVVLSVNSCQFRKAKNEKMLWFGQKAEDCRGLRVDAVVELKMSLNVSDKRADEESIR